MNKANRILQFTLAVLSLTLVGTTACAKVDDNVDSTDHGEFTWKSEPGSLWLIKDKKSGCEYLAYTAGGLQPRAGSCPEFSTSDGLARINPK